jgi:chaperonin GroES
VRRECAASAPQPKGGDVLAVGRGKLTPDGKLLEPRVKVGDKVLFGKYSGTEIELNGQECIAMIEDDILGVVEPLGA